MSDNETISLGPCPTCGGPVQHISDDGVKMDYRHVDLSTVRLERFREIAIDAIQKITDRPNYNPTDLLQHGALVPTWDADKVPVGPCASHPPGVKCMACDSPPVQTWACGTTEGFSSVPPEAKAELRDYAEWLLLPKPRQEFHAWRRSKAEPTP